MSKTANFFIVSVMSSSFLALCVNTYDKARLHRITFIKSLQNKFLFRPEEKRARPFLYSLNSCTALLTGRGIDYSYIDYIINKVSCQYSHLLGDLRRVNAIISAFYRAKRRKRDMRLIRITSAFSVCQIKNTAHVKYGAATLLTLFPNLLKKISDRPETRSRSF